LDAVKGSRGRYVGISVYTVSKIYELIGRLVIHAAWLIYGRRIRLAGAGVVAALALAGGFLVARRQPPEG
jgi:hypothetical protein